ncbi:DMT family transporter [Egbenema bharatensis]|uniref:DMT family transporter n=1 Tax=Egbenema bharatensis TaxID=3463334 RepID=UPI003A83A623
MGWVSGPTPGHSLLMLQMRSTLMLPLMMLISPRVHPGTWADLQQLVRPANRSLLKRVLASSGFLFIAMALLFIALAQIPAGVATVLFFTHPAITVLLSWKWFGDRPSLVRSLVVITVLTGSFLITPGLTGLMGEGILLGVLAAFGAGIGYSLQSMFAQTSFPEIHPAPFTLATFVVMLFLSSLSLLFIHLEVPPGVWATLWVLSLLAGLLTLTGQLFYNLGIRQTSAAIVGIVGISNPTLTTALGWGILGEGLTGRQLLGMGMVIAGVVALSQERRNQAADLPAKTGENESQGSERERFF